MKILLLTDIPPCDNFTAGLVLSAMVRLVPRNAICCFAVVNPLLDLQLADEFGNIPIEMHAKPNENWSWLPRWRFLRRISSLGVFAGEWLTEKTIVRALTRKAVAFGRKQNVDRVWAVLQGQTTIRMAQAVATELGVPLHTHVWDPFSWWAKACCLDGITSRRVQALFDQAISHSSCVATASEPMAKLYRDRLGVAAIPVIASHPRTMAQAPDISHDENAALLIGMAGQFYAAGEWLKLVHALQASKWKVGGRSVRIVVMGPQRPPNAIDNHVSFLGWKSQQDAAYILSQCDALYCPYPFDASMKEVSQYSFPSKLVLYLAAGRPILFHGPCYSSPADYIKDRKCGLIANHLTATAVYNELERLISNPVEYQSMARNAQAAFITDFTLESMANAFSVFIGTPSSGEIDDAQLHDHSGTNTSVSQPISLTAATRRRTVVWMAKETVQRMRWIRTGVRRKIKSFAREAALRIPRLRSIYHEIHAAYAEISTLKRQISYLERENAKLNVLLFVKSETEPIAIEDSKHVPIGIDRAVANISPDLIIHLYPGVKTLVLTRHRQVQNQPTKFTRTNTISPLASAPPHDNVWFTECPFEIEERSCVLGDELSNYPTKGVAILLQTVLREGFERIILSTNIPNDIAVVAKVSRLVSQRFSVVAADELRSCEWLRTMNHVDFINLPASA